MLSWPFITKLGLFLATWHPLLHILSLVLVGSLVALILNLLVNNLLLKGQLRLPTQLKMSFIASGLVVLAGAAILFAPYLIGAVTYAAATHFIRSIVITSVVETVIKNYGTFGIPLLLAGICFVFIYALYWLILRSQKKEFSEKVYWSTDFAAFIFTLLNSVGSAIIIFLVFIAGLWLIARCDQIIASEFHFFSTQLTQRCTAEEKTLCPKTEVELEDLSREGYQALHTCGQTVYEFREGTGEFFWIFRQTRNVWVASSHEPQGYGFYYVPLLNDSSTSLVKRFPPSYEGPWDRVR